VAERTITSPIPLRLVALQGRSAYSAMMSGLRPFDITMAPIDRLRAQTMVERKPALTDLLMSAPEAEQQIVSGIYQLESGSWRWMSQTGVLLLRPPAETAPLVVQFSIPDQSTARQVSMDLNGQRVAAQTFTAPGRYVLTSAPMNPGGDSAQVTITVDKTFAVPGDTRQLGIILQRVGFSTALEPPAPVAQRSQSVSHSK
jgi:hypothetical protein